jgi:hypothetical protein
MKHAGGAALDRLEPLLIEVRARPGLRERHRGVFYAKGGAYLHFHEDPSGLFADLKVEGDWIRFDVTTPSGRQALMEKMKAPG